MQHQKIGTNQKSTFVLKFEADLSSLSLSLLNKNQNAFIFLTKNVFLNLIFQNVKPQGNSQEHEMYTEKHPKS